MDGSERAPPVCYALDHLLIQSPSLDHSLKWAAAAGFVAHEGGRHSDNVTENVLVPFQDGTYLELISFVDPPPPGVRPSEHWLAQGAMRGREGVIDWCVNGADQEDHLASLGGDEAYSPPQAGGRRSKDGHDIRWVVSFPQARPRGELPFVCTDLTPRAWRLPRLPPGGHPNGAVGIKSITLLARPTRMVRLFNPLVTLLGRASAEPIGTSSDKTSIEFPPRVRSLGLSAPSGLASPRIMVHGRDAETQSEQEWVAKVGEGLYEVQVACENRTLASDSLPGLAGLRLAPM